jgi:hypothetical protein
MIEESSFIIHDIGLVIRRWRRQQQQASVYLADKQLVDSSKRLQGGGSGGV